MNLQSRRIASGLLGVAAGLAFSLAGCGDPNVGRVSGRITLDGQPLPKAQVHFSPKKGRRGSAGITDEQGRYTLVYTRSSSGAEIGEHAVAITTFTAEDPYSDPPVARAPELIPTHFNQQTKLKAEVAPGRNTFDFKLESGGEIVQPDAPGRDDE